MSAHQEDVVSNAALAKAALRLLAERRLMPTPENYEQAWRRVAGDRRAPLDHDHHAAAASNERISEAVQASAKSANGAPQWFVDGLIAQLVELRLIGAEPAAEARRAIATRDWMLTGQIVHAAVADRASIHWGPLIGQLQAAFAANHRGWTLARKREAIGRVIDAAGHRDEQLYTRLHALIESWQREPTRDGAEAGAIGEGPGASSAGAASGAGELAPLAGASGALSALATTTTASGADATVSPDGSTDLFRAQRDGRLIHEMSALLSTLCENLVDMSEQTSWIRGQVDVLRDSLRAPEDHRRLSEVRRTIAHNADSQRRLQANRRTSVDEVKLMISTWIESVGELSRSTGAFGSRIDGYVESINRVDSVDALSQTVRAMLDDTQAMSREIQTSHDEMAVMRSRALALESQVSRLEDELANASTQMIVDHLTQTMNRRGLEQAFAGAQARAHEFHAPLALAVLDVDDFKRVNDTLGHKGGDDALQQLARIFKLKLRATDAVARFGGEEFVLLLPDMNTEQAVAHVVRLQREVTSHVFMSDQNRMFITFSAGVTMVMPSDNLTGAVERADRAMYAAKQAGKNCVRAV